MIITVYHWASGAYVNTYDSDFDTHYHELCEQYGFPYIALTNVRDI